MKKSLKRLSRIGFLLSIALAMTGCKEELSPLAAESGELMAGDPVMFTTYVPGAAKTRDAQAEFNTKMQAYKVIDDDYTLTVEMFAKGTDEGAAPVSKGSGTYKPVKTTTTNDETGEESVTYDTYGTLQFESDGSGLYWPDNVTEYGFKATAGTETMDVEPIVIDENTTVNKVNQSTKEKLLEHDRLLGYGFEPLWNSDAGEPFDKETALNFRTSKEWYQANKKVQESEGLPDPARNTDSYKKIPLYLQHQRSMITVILKAGKGITREELNVSENVDADIFNYGTPSGSKTIMPLESHTMINYGTEETPDNVETLQYTAIVDPYDYKTNEGSVIAEVRLSGQRYTFFSSSDNRYTDSKNGVADAVAHMENYNLTAGKHLVITATIGLGSRNIVITAYVEDWTEMTTASIVDDFGQTGDPIVIQNRDDLYTFLSDPQKNKAGNVAIINPSYINLEQDKDGNDLPWNYDNLKLNCTLNMAGAVFYTTHRVFSEITPSGNLVNGTIGVGENATVTSAVAGTNGGTIEHVTVLPQRRVSELVVAGTNGYATVAGLVETNTGTILDCRSDLPVLGTSGMVGGIAATSRYASEDATMPVIDGCTVNARVAAASGATGVKGGGIVGSAIGRVTNNTFEYGITLLQTDFKNIFYEQRSNGDLRLRAYGNAWPTIAKNTSTDAASTNENITPSDERYDATIDSQEELKALLTNAYNITGKKYRISSDFEVSNWREGKVNDIVNETGGNVFFELDGNGKTITTDGMLFTNIQKDIYDLTIRLSKDLIATYDNSKDAIAPLAYAVKGATIRNIKVKGGGHRVQAANASGVVVWAYDKAVVENCQSNASIQVYTTGLATGAEIYSGGIVAMAADAIIDRCIYHASENTMFRNTATDGTSSPEATQTPGIFYGGILGATFEKSAGNTTYHPSVLITDCTSWYGPPYNEYKGAIVGKSVYSVSGSVGTNGLAEGCQGNWWPTTGYPIGTHIAGTSEEQLIGKRNGVQPTRDQQYED